MSLMGPSIQVVSINDVSHTFDGWKAYSTVYIKIRSEDIVTIYPRSMNIEY